MVETIGTHWRRLLALLVVILGAVLAWLSTTWRRPADQSGRTWSELPVPPPVDVAPAPAPTPQPAPTAESAPRSAANSAAVAEPVGDVMSEPEIVVEPEPASGPRLGPYPGSVLPLDDGSAPSAEYVIKGNAGSMRCHAASSPYFGRTRAQVWFRTEDEAIAAGFRPWTRKK